MSHILIVDDSALERTIVAGVLKKRFLEASVSTAENGSQALELLDSSRFDLIITDLMMPGIDGLELVQEIRRRELDVPVILMTSFGNEETALKALRAGAVSYVPKREFDLLLVPTVENVLSLSQSQRSKARLLSCLAESENKFTFANDISLIAPFISHVQDQIRSMRLLDERDVVRVSVALNESLANAILHGNLEVSSDLRQEDESIFHLLADQRRKQAPYADRRVFVSVKMSATEIRFTVRDQGPGFDTRKVMDPNQPIDLERIGGRGLLLMRSFTDVVFHNASGNEITLIKFAKAAVPSSCDAVTSKPIPCKTHFSIKAMA